MRILLSGVPAFGHLLPLAAIARAAHAAGHELRLLTSAGMTEAMALDLPEAPVLGAGPMPDAIFAEVARRLGGQDPAADPRPESVAEFFAGARVDLTVDRAIEVARAWRPDLIIAEATDFVGPLVAAELAVPWNVLAFGPAVPDEFAAPMRAVVASRYADRGLTPTAPEHYLDPAPLSLQPEGWTPPVDRLPFRVEPHRRAAQSGYVPTDGSKDGKRVVLVTLGTVFAGSHTLDAIVGSIDRSRFEIVATTGLLPDASRPDLVDGVRYVSFVPLAELLVGVDVVVNSGGAGTVLATLSRGIPMVVLPQGADQFVNAERSASSGAALVVNDPSAAGAALTTVADEASFRAAAERIAADIRAMPSASDVVAELTGPRAGRGSGGVSEGAVRV